MLSAILVLSLLPCVCLALRKHISLTRARQYDGMVTGHVTSRGTKGRTNYALQITYRDSRGNEQQFVTSATSSSPECAVGEKIVVFEHAAGGEPEIMLFNYLYLHYWLWFCAGIAALGCLVAPSLLRSLYCK